MDFCSSRVMLLRPLVVSVLLELGVSWERGLPRFEPQHQVKLDCAQNVRFPPQNLQTNRKKIARHVTRFLEPPSREYWAYIYTAKPEHEGVIPPRSMHQ